MITQTLRAHVIAALCYVILKTDTLRISMTQSDLCVTGVFRSSAIVLPNASEQEQYMEHYITRV